MKYLILLFLAHFMFTITVHSQNKEQRIAVIRQMYSEAQSLIQNKKEVKCSNGNSPNYESLNPESEKIKFDQPMKKCTLPKFYTVYEASFRGFHWYENIFIYLKSGKVFFAYFESGGEGCEKTDRVYLDEMGNIIRYLEKTENCEENNGSKELKDKESIIGIKNKILSKIKEIETSIDKK